MDLITIFIATIVGIICFTVPKFILSELQYQKYLCQLHPYLLYFDRGVFFVWSFVDCAFKFQPRKRPWVNCSPFSRQIPFFHNWNCIKHWMEHVH